MKFELEQRVRLLPLDLYGIIKQISIVQTGTQYLVRYFFNSKAEEVFMYEKELEAA